jgi:hypothetical protein
VAPVSALYEGRSFIEADDTPMMSGVFLPAAPLGHDMFLHETLRAIHEHELSDRFIFFPSSEDDASAHSASTRPLILFHLLLRPPLSPEARRYAIFEDIFAVIPPLFLPARRFHILVRQNSLQAVLYSARLPLLKQKETERHAADAICRHSASPPSSFISGSR